MSRSRYPPLRFGPHGERLCRGCGAPVPPRRRTWCSQACYDLHDWQQICRRVWVRDGGVCQLCGESIGELRQAWMDRFEAWRRANPRARSRDYREPVPYPEFDHIVPFADGGPTLDDNIRLVCAPCHRRRTRLWRQARRIARAQLPLPPPVPALVEG